jgi:hypothetical protein
MLPGQNCPGAFLKEKHEILEEGMKKYKIQILSLIFGITLQLSAQACGYHDLAQARIGALNWLYEHSLYVNGAIVEAQTAGRLSPSDNARFMVSGPYREELDAQAFEKTKQSLLDLGAVFQVLEGEHTQSGFSIVLVETALWTRFPASGSDAALEVDAGAAGEGDLVVATGEPVVDGLLQGRLSIAEALDSGCVRLYGSPEQVSGFRETYGTVGGQAEREDQKIEAKRLILIPACATT